MTHDFLTQTVVSTRIYNIFRETWNRNHGPVIDSYYTKVLNI